MNNDEMIKIDILTYDHIYNETICKTVYEKKLISLSELADKYWDDSDGLEPVFAVVDSTGRDMSYRLKRSCTVKLLDLRARLARLVYQRSVYFIFLVALSEVLPGAKVSLKYPLNGGIFIKAKSEIKQNDASKIVWQIEKHMKDMVHENVGFTKRIIKRSEILHAAEETEKGNNSEEYLSVLKNITPEQVEFIKGNNVQEVFEYTCRGYSAVFYDPLIESAGILGTFELVPYDGNLIIRLPESLDPTGLIEYRDDVKLYKALKDISQWQSYVEVRTIADLNRKLSSEEWREFILINEAMHEKKIAMIADRIVKENKRIILVAGPSSSGKTTFAQRLCIQLRVNGKKPLYMGTDDYFVEKGQAPKDENGKYNFEDLEAVDVELFNNQMNALLAGETVDLPVFDFITGSKRYGTRITKADPDQPIVIEGIHALNGRLTYHIDESEKFRVYISPLTTLNIDDKNRIPLTDIRFIRRMARDMRSRNKTARQTIAEWPDVRAGEKKNIFPYNGEADVLFNSTLLYELAMLKPLVEDSLMEIGEEEPQYLEAQRLLRILRCVQPQTETTDITGNSIIREFIGGGIWVK
jgi:uridine kinase